MGNTASGILERMMSNIPQKYNRAAGGYIHDILAPVAYELESEHIYIDDNTKRFLVATAEGNDLDELLSQFGYKRKAATFASGFVTITGAENALIAEGSLVSKGTTTYIVEETTSLIGGKATVSVRASVEGSSGNAEVGTVNYFPVTLDGIIGVTNEERITGGTDKESDEEYRERYYYFLDHPVTSGNKYEYEQWAREVDGVGLAKCYPLWNGPGTVKVVITTAEVEEASPELVSEVAEYIEDRRPIGASVTVESAGTVPVSVSAIVHHDPSYSVDGIKERYIERLSGYLKEVGFEGGIIPYTKIGSILQELSGVEYYSELLVNDIANNNIIVSEGQLAVLGGVEIVSG